MTRTGDDMACDTTGCSERLHLDPSQLQDGFSDGKEASRYAAQQGWTSTKGRDYCREHSST